MYKFLYKYVFYNIIIVMYYDKIVIVICISKNIF